MNAIKLFAVVAFAATLSACASTSPSIASISPKAECEATGGSYEGRAGFKDCITSNGFLALQNAPRGKGHSVGQTYK